MTIDEAIKHAEEVAEENQRVVNTGIVFEDVTIDMLYCDDTEVIEEHLANYQECANKHRQLAEWLKELKQLREQTQWIPVSENLPKDFGTYLITLENGDVCKCEFNPDFIDEEHENGAFTYCHQYFDPATLGLIDEEEEAVDAIAWMPFEPYEPQEESEDE